MQAIENLIARVFGIPEAQITDNVSYQSIPEWDSLGHVRLVLALETELGITIGDDMMVHLNTVSSIKDFIGFYEIHGKDPVLSASSMQEQKKLSRGLSGVYLDRTTISNIDPRNGVLEYRGYPIADLVENSTFEETIHLLLFGDLPNSTELEKLTQVLKSNRHLPEEVVELIRALTPAHPMDVLTAAIAVLNALEGDCFDVSEENARIASLRLISQVPLILGTHYASRTGRRICDARKDCHSAYVLRMLGIMEPSIRAISCMEKCLILHAEHGANASALAARTAIGCESNIHQAIISATSVFTGRIHGGASEEVLKMLECIEAPEHAKDYVEARLQHNKPIPGFGHRIYKTQDPRSSHLRKLARELSSEMNEKEFFAILDAIVDAMAPYSTHGIQQNVDLYTGLVYKLLNLPSDFVVALFAAGRFVGWAAHSLEQRRNNILIRPLLEYVGLPTRSYISSHSAHCGEIHERF